MLTVTGFVISFFVADAYSIVSPQMPTFAETQQNVYRWYVLGFAVLSSALFGWWIWHAFVGDWQHDDEWMLVLVATSNLLFSMGLVYVAMFRKLSTHIDQTGVRFRIKPFGRWQTIHWSDIERAYVREFTLVGEYPMGFGGFRQGPNGWAYVIRGTYGLQIHKTSGGKILIGTQRPDELRAFLAARPLSPDSAAR